MNSAALASLLSSTIAFPVVSGLNPQEDAARFLEFSKTAEDDPSRASRLSKTFPEVPIVFRDFGGKPESRLSTSLALGRVQGWLGTWDPPDLLAVSRS